MNISRHWLLLGALALAACSNTDVRDTLGINKAAPDEFVVVSRPPLSVPPEFDLRPPRPGEAPRVPAADAQARSTLLGSESQPALSGETSVAPVTSADAPSSAAANFLSRAGVDAADEQIRTKLTTDSVTPVQNENAESLYEEIIGSQKKEPVLDPEKETERLKQNKEQGKPANEGDVPTQEDKPSVIDTIF